MLPREYSLRRAFSLVELLVALAIIGSLSGLLLPAVQAVREASRRLSCANNLRNQAQAVLLSHDSQRKLPPGRLIGPRPAVPLDFSWTYFVLPYLEQSNLYVQIDASVPWNYPRNTVAREVSLTLMRCPSSIVEFAGDSDYSGILGTVMETIPGQRVGGSPFDRGVLVNVHTNEDYVRLSDVSDGCSNTICLGEAVDFLPSESGFWVSGLNCISHDKGGVNTERNGINSLHSQGANVAKLDGSVVFLSESIAPHVVGALCTRAGGESVDLGW